VSPSSTFCAEMLTRAIEDSASYETTNSSAETGNNRGSKQATPSPFRNQQWASPGDGLHHPAIPFRMSVDSSHDK
jgi:hypothetical protein